MQLCMDGVCDSVNDWECVCVCVNCRNVQTLTLILLISIVVSRPATFTVMDKNIWPQTTHTHTITTCPYTKTAVQHSRSETGWHTCWHKETIHTHRHRRCVCVCGSVCGPVGLCLNIYVLLRLNPFPLWFPVTGVKGQLAWIRGHDLWWPPCHLNALKRVCTQQACVC